MSQSIHGHEVMEMMLEEGGHFTRASLREAIEARFGADSQEPLVQIQYIYMVKRH